MKNKGLRLTLLLLLTTGWFILMKKLTAPLDPGTIIAFEFIGTAEKAEAFLSNLKESGHLDLLTRGIFLDFIFPLFYGATLYYASAWACHKLPKTHPLNRFRLLSSMTVIAVASDLLENISLLKLVYYPPADMFAYSAFFFAGLKFLLLTLVILHFFAGRITIMRNKKKA